MHVCPPEIHSYICELACLDDGRTVRALNLVSRYFRSISRPHLFQSAAVRGLSNISILLSKIEKLHPSQSKRLRHLFVLDQESAEQPHLNVENFLLRHRIHTLRTSYVILLTRLISLAAPTVETFTLILNNTSQSTPVLAHLFRTYFPCLRELSLSGFYPLFSSSLSPLPLFPVLTHLHLHGNRNPHGLFQPGGLSMDVCPSLTHQRS